MRINIRILICLLVLSMAFHGCQTQETAPKVDEIIAENLLIEKDLKEKIVVYQLFVRLFGNKKNTQKRYGTIEENGVGKFSDISDKALSELKDFGVTHVWYTGVLEHAVMQDYRKYNIDIDNANVVKGRAGSPYAIKDYYDVNPDLADQVDQRMEEFDSLMSRTKKNGLKVMIDFVPNHVARQYHSDAKPEGIKDLGEGDDTSVFFKADNNFYYMGEPLKVPSDYDPLGLDHAFVTEATPYQEDPAKATGNNIFSASPSVGDWFETVKINYGVDYKDGEKKHFDPIPNTWEKMRDILAFWTNKGVDGFRCDFVQFTPVEFWEWVIPQIKEINPDIIFIAEIYIPHLYDDFIVQGKFDFLYDKVQLYDTVRHLMSGVGSTDNLPQIWKSQRGMNKNMIRFLENHDEQRVASPFFAGSAAPGIPGMTLSATLYTGPSMLYFGQEVGEPAQGDSGFSSDDGRSTIFDYWSIPEHQKWMNGGKFDGEMLSAEQKKLRAFYKKLNRLCTEKEALAKGHLLDLHEYNRQYNSDKGYSDKVYAYLRFTEKESLLVVVNFTDTKPKPANITLSQAMMKQIGLDPSKQYVLTDLLGSNKKLDLTQGTVTVELEAWDAYIFEIAK